MADNYKRTDADKKIEKLRALRLANAAARKEAGTWGDTSVGEIVHEVSRSAFVHVWKGERRPDPFGTRRVRAGMAQPEWQALVGWVNGRSAGEFRHRIVGWNLSPDEASKIAASRTAEHRAAGYRVIGPEDADAAN